MKLLYLSYWGIDDPLTVSTIMPNLDIIAGFERVERVYLCTVERTEEGLSSKRNIHPKAVHVPLLSRNRSNLIATKFGDYINFPVVLGKLIREQGIDGLLARTASAGALAYLAHKKTGIPIYIESFEPHAEYMRESNEWPRLGLRYQLQKYWERQQKKHASALITVSENYRDQLIKEGIDKHKVHLIPCTVDTGRFGYSASDRLELRDQLRIPQNAVTGIYLGKFGGIYYDEEAFSIFKRGFEHFGDNFRLIILTPGDKQQVQTRLSAAGIEQAKTLVDLVPHNQIPKYLSAADFGFSTIKPAVSRKFCSPVKDGEYWANGLPILLTDGVGDDYQIIDKENAGAIYRFASNGSLDRAYEKLSAVLAEPGHRDRITKVAAKYRDVSIAKRVYEQLFS